MSLVLLQCYAAEPYVAWSLCRYVAYLSYNAKALCSAKSLSRFGALCRYIAYAAISHGSAAVLIPLVPYIAKSLYRFSCYVAGPFVLL